MGKKREKKLEQRISDLEWRVTEIQLRIIGPAEAAEAALGEMMLKAVRGDNSVQTREAKQRK